MLESLICVWLLRDISCFRYSTRKEKNAFGDRLEKRKFLIAFLICVVIINLFLLLRIAAWIMNDIPYTGFLMGRPYGVS